MENIFGVKEDALNWFKSYLQPRNFKVCVNNIYSSLKNITFSVPQGSISGPDLWNKYCSTLRNIIPDNILLNGFADDHSSQDSFTPNRLNPNAESSCINRLEDKLRDIKQWMLQNRLKMNDQKTEFILFGNKPQLLKTFTKLIDVCGNSVELQEVVRYLGAWLDKFLNFDHHTKIKCKAAISNIFRISQIRKLLSQEACKILMCSLVLSHLDYSNGILFGMSKKNIRKLQIVQNFAARVTLQEKKHYSSRQALLRLHWLPIEARIIYKILCIVFKCLHDFRPHYLSSMLIPKKFKRSTASDL